MSQMISVAGVQDQRESESTRWNRNRRWSVLIAVHLFVFAGSYFAAFLLRFEFVLAPKNLELLIWTLPGVVVLKLAVFYGLGSFHSQWRFVTFADLAMLLKAVTVSWTIILAIDFLVLDGQIPITVMLIDWGVTVIALGGIRSTTRFFHEHFWPTIMARKKRLVFIIGAGERAEALARQMHVQSKLDYRVIGFLDRDPANQGSRISGIPFLGSPCDAVSIARKKQVTMIFVIAGSLNGSYLRTLHSECRQANIHVKMIPPIEELLQRNYQLQVRKVHINDLLHRDPVQLDTESIARMLKGRRVMVTGAGGSIGSEICRQIVRHRPERLILVERAENSLFHIEQELKEFRDLVCHACVADVCDEERLHVLFQTHEPHVVFHAAAHKHVPLMEINVGEAIKNNVFGTKNMADLSHKYDVDRFILISTDKVVNPTSVMGISKKLCERYVHSLAETSATNYVVVRFGNVLGSNGSVVPTFQEQIRRGGPVTVTHAEMRRFFMTIPEASQLVLQAAVLGKGGEIFVLDMGEPVKIVDLAKDLIRLSGFSEDEIPITYIGIRPGEKLYEEIYDAGEKTVPTKHPKLRMVFPPVVEPEEIQRCLAEVQPLVNASEDEVRQKLNELLASLKRASERVVPMPFDSELNTATETDTKTAMEMNSNPK